MAQKKVLIIGATGSVGPNSKVSIPGPVKQPINYTLPPGAEMLVVNFRSDKTECTIAFIVVRLKPG